MFKFLCILFLLLLNQAQALTLQPDKVEFSPQVFTQNIQITNDQNKSLKIDFSLHDFVMNDEARLHLVDTFDFSLKPYISISPTQLVLNPNDVAMARIYLDAAALENEGDMHTHLTLDVTPLNESWGAVTTSQPLLFKQMEDVQVSDFELKDVQVQGHQIALDFTKLNNLKHLMMWVEGYVVQGKSVKPAFYPFFNKMYREVNRIQRQVNVVNAPKTGDILKVYVYSSPQKERLLHTFEMAF